MNQFLRWANMSPRQRMLEAMSGGAHPTMGLEVRDARTGTQLGIEALHGLGAEPLVREGLIRTVEANNIVSMQSDGGRLAPTATPISLLTTNVEATATSQPAPDISARFVPNLSPLARRVPTTVYSTEPTSAIRTETREEYDYSGTSSGREGGAPEDYQYSYGGDEEEAGDIKPVEQYRQENPIAQTAEMAAQSRAATGGGLFESMRGWWETQSTPVKLVVGAAVLYGGYKLMK